NLNPVIGSEQGGTRPVLILQNDIGNRHSPTTIVAAVTSQIKKAKLPTHVDFPKEAPSSIADPWARWARRGRLTGAGSKSGSRTWTRRRCAGSTLRSLSAWGSSRSTSCKYSCNEVVRESIFGESTGSSSAILP